MDNIPQYTSELEAMHKKRLAVRIASVTFIVICSVFLAVMAGTMLALADGGRTSDDLMALLNGSYVYARTQEELARIADEEEARGDVTGDTMAATGEVVSNNEGNSEEAAGSDEESDGTTIADMYHSDPEDIDVNNEVVNDVEANDYIDPDVGYPRDYASVDESYFDDALFIGDSRLQGFGMYSGLPGTFYAATGFQLYKYDTMKVVNTEEGKVPILDALPYDTFTKIYIKVGLNEMGGNDNIFESRYVELIEKLRQSEPRAVIYIHGILPVTASKSQSDKVHNNANVIKRNEQLRKIADEQGAYYLDVGSALAGPDGALPSEMASDGIHLKAQYMDVWKQYLLTHAVL